MYFWNKKNKLSDSDILKLKWFTNNSLNFWYNFWIWLSEFNKNQVKILLYINWEYKYKSTINLKEK